MPEVEKYKFSNISLKDLLKKEIIDELEKSKLNISLVNMVFINEEGDAGNKTAYPIVLNHKNNRDLKDQILHLDSPNPKLLKIFTDLLIKLGGK